MTVPGRNDARGIYLRDQQEPTLALTLALALTLTLALALTLTLPLPLAR